jgi:mRNA-degrading endonuclease RelE of RelBE toxin-antitoxin system
VKLVIAPDAAVAIRHLPPGLKKAVRDAIATLAVEPHKGEPLRRELAAYHKFRVRRFRIVYQIERKRRTVRVIAVGARASIYEELAARIRGA